MNGTRTTPAPRGTTRSRTGRSSWLVFAALGTALAIAAVVLVVGLSNPRSDRRILEELNRDTPAEPTDTAPPSDLQPAAAPKSEPKTAALLKAASPALVHVVARDKAYQVSGEGGGVLLSADGVVAVNAQVMHAARFATVAFSDGRLALVEGVLAHDEPQDLALVKIAGDGLPYLECGPAQTLDVGTKVYVVNSARGAAPTLHEGEVNGPRPIPRRGEFVQLALATAPAARGGPVLDDAGRLCAFGATIPTFAPKIVLAAPAARVQETLDARKPLRPLASAGGGVLEPPQATTLSAALDALAAKDYARALALLGELRASQQDARYYWPLVGQVQYASQKYRQAASAYRLALKHSPDSADLHLKLGRCYARMEDTPAALQEFQAAETLEPDSADVLRELAAEYLAAGQTKRGLALLQDLIDRKQATAEDYQRQGEVLLADKKHVAAAEAFATAARLAPRDAAALYGLGACYAALGRGDIAVSTLKAAIELAPGNAAYHAKLGQVYLSQNLHRDAIAALRQSLAIREAPETLLQLAAAYWDSGQRELALEQVKKAAKLDGAERQRAEEALKTVEAQLQSGLTLQQIDKLPIR